MDLELNINQIPHIVHKSKISAKVAQFLQNYPLVSNTSTQQEFYLILNEANLKNCKETTNWKRIENGFRTKYQSNPPYRS